MVAVDTTLASEKVKFVCDYLDLDASYDDLSKVISVLAFVILKNKLRSHPDADLPRSQLKSPDR